MSTHELSRPASKTMQIASPKISIKDAIIKMKAWSYYFTEITSQTTFYMPVRFGRNNRNSPKNMLLYIETARTGSKSRYPCDGKCQAFKKALACELGRKNTINIQDTPCISLNLLKTQTDVIII